MKEISQLAENARKASSDEFLSLINEVVKLLTCEHGRIGNIKITGKLAELEPVGTAIVVGDIHGDLESLLHILKEANFVDKVRKNEETVIVFLGDYGDRGDYSAEVYYVILKLKSLFSERVVLMRGNHEGPDDLLAYPHDLPMQLRRKFGENDSALYAKLRELFNQLYNAVVVKEQYLMVHGGVSSGVSSLDDLAYAHKTHPVETFLEEILWSDPTEAIKETCASPRGAGKLFGKHVTDRILKMSDTNVLIRGHEPCKEGFKINHAGKILTLFSRKGPPYHNDCAAYLEVDLSEKVENARQLVPCIRKF
ncbi:MAG: metallophosphoesterase family protein [Thermoproteota archaeon]|nr:metallophosphoesterase family protein [Thermoproteota archaeon]